MRADELLTADRGFYSWQAWDTAAATGDADVAPVFTVDNEDHLYLAGVPLVIGLVVYWVGDIVDGTLARLLSGAKNADDKIRI